jgi:N-formylglutamate deformylase
MNDHAIYTLTRGTTPLLVSLPHAGTSIPPAIVAKLQPRALQCEDTDWHLDRLYAFAAELGASLIVPRHSRYVVDLNRPSDNQPMYAGTNNTELCPTRFFSGDALYREGQAPTEPEVRERVATFWQPYHDALRAELQRLRDAHGCALLWDGHSIKSELPWLFDGRLPDLNLGTAAGASCAPGLREALADVLQSQAAFTVAIDGRFKGGHITRHYGRPAEHVHAVQLEMCWRTYMDETPPFAWDAAQAARVQPLLRRLLQAMLAWRPC